MLTAFNHSGVSNKLNQYMASNFPSVNSSQFQLMASTVSEIALYAIQILINFFPCRTHIFAINTTYTQNTEQL